MVNYRQCVTDLRALTVLYSRPNSAKKSCRSSTGDSKMSVNVSWKSLIIPLAMNAQYLKTINYDVALLCYLCALESMCEGFFLVHIIILWFPQECPSGVVNEETFKSIYSQFFPQGGQSHSLPFIPCFTFYSIFFSKELGRRKCSVSCVFNVFTEDWTT